MINQTIGTAVLDDVHGSEYLFVVCRMANGKIEIRHIPVYKLGEQKPCGTAWQYQILSEATSETKGRLRMTPSLRILGNKEGQPDQFHNSYQWEVDYLLRRSASEQVRDVNKDLQIEIH